MARRLWYDRASATLSAAVLDVACRPYAGRRQLQTHAADDTRQNMPYRAAVGLCCCVGGLAGLLWDGAPRLCTAEAACGRYATQKGATPHESRPHLQIGVLQGDPKQRSRKRL